MHLLTKADWSATPSLSMIGLGINDGLVLNGSEFPATTRIASSVAGAGDVNGDGFDDMLLGGPFLPPFGAGIASVVFGKDFRNDAATPGGTQTGTAGADVLVGGGGNDTLNGLGANDRLIGGLGDDTLDGGTGVDVLIGGAGNDTLIYDSADRRVDGGTGSDTLKFTGAGQTLDFTALAAAKAQGGTYLNITSIEHIDLRGSGDNTLKLTLHDVLNLTENLDPVFGGNSNTLFVRADSGDTVTSTGWAGATTSNVTVSGVDYKMWTLGQAHLLIETAITPTIT